MANIDNFEVVNLTFDLVASIGSNAYEEGKTEVETDNYIFIVDRYGEIYDIDVVEKSTFEVLLDFSYNYNKKTNDIIFYIDYAIDEELFKTFTHYTNVEYPIQQIIIAVPETHTWTENVIALAASYAKSFYIGQKKIEFSFIN